MEAKNPIKKRDAVYCNLKLFLIFLVIYGHMLEGRICESAPLMQIYRMIYSFHMPLFLFLSGLFLTDSGRCSQQMKQMLVLYFPLQSAAVFLCNLLGGHFSLWVPVWHLWYLLSLASMDLLGLLWCRLVERFPLRMDKGTIKAGIVIGSLLLSCGMGYVPAVGRFFSLSRTLCFLPYFFLGLFLPKDMDWKKFRPAGLAGLCVWLVLLGLWGSRVPVNFFYQADCYALSGIADAGVCGFLCRLLSFFQASGMGLFLLAFAADSRLSASRLGADTLVPFLVHAPLVGVIVRLADFFPEMSAGRWNFFSVAAGIYVIYLCYKLPQWRRQMCRIAAGRREMRDGDVPGNL